MPMRVACSTRKGENNSVAGFVVPIEGGILAVGHLVRAIFAIDNLLCIVGAIGIMLFANIISR